MTTLGLDHIYYIAQGVVQIKWVFKDANQQWYVPVATFAEHEVIGLLEVLYKLPVAYQVVATTAVKLVCIPKTMLSQIPPKMLKQSEEICFEMWLSWVDRFLNVLRKTVGQVRVSLVIVIFFLA